MQTAVDHASNTGVDIRNLSGSDTNTFQSNICLTSVNAPCPVLGPPSLTASPNPIPVTGAEIHGMTTITWVAPGAEAVEVRIGSPNGQLFASGGKRGSAQTGLWVADGMTFYLQEVTKGKPLASNNTLATIVVHLQRTSAANSHPPGGPHRWSSGASSILLCFALCGVLVQTGSRRKRLWIDLRGAILLAGVGFSLSNTKVLAQSSQTGPSSASAPALAQQTATKLDEMIAGGASSTDLAQYVFNNHGCRNCHTMGRNGKLGFTDRGKERAQGFEGCISTLKAMSIIAKVPENRRSVTQRQRAQRFEEFGCVTCHKAAPDKMDLTPVGAKLSRLHLGCVDVEKILANAPASKR